MSDITKVNPRPQPPMRPMPEHPEITAQRHATAIAEINKMREDHAVMAREVAESHREIDELRARCRVLEEDKQHYRDAAAVYQRKLMRLCAAMQNIGFLSEEAMVIMKDARDYEEQSGKKVVAEPPKMQSENQINDQIGENIQREVIHLLKGEHPRNLDESH